MQYFKNIEISRQYKVTPTTVANWIESAIEKRNKLELVEVRGKHRILNNAHNHIVMEQLVKKGKVHKSKQSLKVVEPDPKFYEIFNLPEVSEIISDLENHRLINPKFTFKDKGAQMWNEYFNRSEDQDSILNSPTMDLLSKNIQYLMKGAQDITVNIVELFAVNGLYSSKIITLLNSLGISTTYSCIDLSNEMIELSINNVKNNNPNIKTHSVNIDPEYNRLNEHVNHQRFNNKEKSINLILCMENVFGNVDERSLVLSSIRNAMRKNDILVIGNSVYTPEVITTFSGSNLKEVKNKHSYLELRYWLAKLIGLDIDKCERNYKYNSLNKTKERSITLDKDYEIEFREGVFARSLNLNKGEEIKLSRHQIFTKQEFINEIFEVNLDLIGITQDKSDSMAFYFCKIK